MVVKILQDIFEMIASSLNILVTAVMSGMDLGLDRMSANIPGLNVFGKVMMALGIAVVFWCIITESFRLVLSPFSGQSRGSGFVTIFRCVIAGVLVVLIFSASLQVLKKAVQPFYEMVIEWSEEDVTTASLESYRDQTIAETGKTPDEIIDEYETIKERRDAATNGYVQDYWDKELQKLQFYYDNALAYQNGDTEALDEWDMKAAMTNQLNEVMGETGELAMGSVFSLKKGAAMLFVLAVIIIMLVRFVQLVLSLLMRYITFGIAIYMGPLCMGFLASPATSEIPKLWLKTVVSQIILFMATTWGMSIMYRSLIEYPEDMTAFDLIIKLAFIFTFGKLILKLDELLNRLGFNTMPTVDNARGGLYGAAMLGMMAFRAFKGGGGGGRAEKSTVQPERTASATSNNRLALRGINGTSAGGAVTGKIGSVSGVRPMSAQNKAWSSVNDALDKKGSISNGTMEKAFHLEKNSGGRVSFSPSTNAQVDSNYDAIHTSVLTQGHNGGTEEKGMYVSINESGVYQMNADGSYVGNERRYVDHRDFQFTGEYVDLGNGVKGWYTSPKETPVNETRDPANSSHNRSIGRNK